MSAPSLLRVPEVLPGASNERVLRAEAAQPGSAAPPAGVPGVHVRMDASECARGRGVSAVGLALSGSAAQAAAGSTYRLRLPANPGSTLPASGMLTSSAASSCPERCARWWQAIAGCRHPTALPAAGSAGAVRLSSDAGASAARFAGLAAPASTWCAELPQHAPPLSDLTAFAAPTGAGRFMLPGLGGLAGLPGALGGCAEALCRGERSSASASAHWASSCAGGAGRGTGSRQSVPKRGALACASAPRPASLPPFAWPPLPDLPLPGPACPRGGAALALLRPQRASFSPRPAGTGRSPKIASSSSFLAFVLAIKQGTGAVASPCWAMSARPLTICCTLTHNLAK